MTAKNLQEEVEKEDINHPNGKLSIKYTISTHTKIDAVKQTIP